MFKFQPAGTNAILRRKKSDDNIIYRGHVLEASVLLIIFSSNILAYRLTIIMNYDEFDEIFEHTI